MCLVLFRGFKELFAVRYFLFPKGFAALYNAHSLKPNLATFAKPPKNFSCQTLFRSARLTNKLNVAEVVKTTRGNQSIGAHPEFQEEDFFAFSPSANLVGVIEEGHEGFSARP
ncbi:MAG: hypothetical protein JSS81_25380 [Acidobacteria bacterium]|nr:hypothetical protein [Acidobacteriota bacterium]